MVRVKTSVSHWTRWMREPRTVRYVAERVGHCPALPIPSFLLAFLPIPFLSAKAVRFDTPLDAFVRLL
jgi:hypothetical protein